MYAAPCRLRACMHTERAGVSVSIVGYLDIMYVCLYMYDGTTAPRHDLVARHDLAARQTIVTLACAGDQTQTDSLYGLRSMYTRWADGIKKFGGEQISYVATLPGEPKTASRDRQKSHLATIPLDVQPPVAISGSGRSKDGQGEGNSNHFSPQRLQHNTYIQTE